jgi:lipopolysaccharide/colanic/teichoic acid biosynthesis glycosyltransferase
VLLAPLMIAIGLLVRLTSPGPALFRQTRVGRDGRTFEMLKYRSMHDGADARKAELLSRNEADGLFKIADDPRITRVGRFLRATSLDELPQLFNVLRGDMSLVGPRPTSFEPSRYELWHTQRLDVRPGITGLWQVEGRNVTTFDERLRLDVQYIRRRSLAFDVILLARTVVVVLRRSGA